jgi:hypothetical protein
MLLSQNLEQLSIDPTILVTKLQEIITSTLEISLNSCLENSAKMRILSKLYKQLNHELQRIANFSKKDKKNFQNLNNNSIKQTTYILKSIKLVIIKLKYIHQKHKESTQINKSLSLNKQEETNAEMSWKRSVDSGLRLFGQNNLSANTFSEMRKGAKIGEQSIEKGLDFYNMRPLNGQKVVAQVSNLGFGVGNKSIKGPNKSVLSITK